MGKTFNEFPEHRIRGRALGMYMYDVVYLRKPQQHDIGNLIIKASLFRC